MLELNQITKQYVVGDNTVHALKGIDLKFRNSEFVSILGPSGCGKTTLLNIIGGLDQYTSGDLIIDGISTKQYGDRDWDTYRNHSIGFVFQSYYLIPHQTVLQNVEMTLTLSGVSKAERRERAIEALKAVGLEAQMNKRPNQMSGGQMQRVAIARALVNNPDIILADEPTGALDTETSIQVMEILKEVSKDRLVLMVTHNPDLAEQYSSRIIRMLDGEIIGDTAPLNDSEIRAEAEADEIKKEEKKDKNKKKSTMSFWTAFKLSLTNLFTKKGRTFLTAFAGSIGIIGIALILAVSQGTTNYINMVQQQTLSSYPLTIESTAMDLTAMVSNMMETRQEKPDHGNDKVYKRSMIYDLVNMVSGSAQKSNDLRSFKSFLEDEVANEDSKLHDAIAGLQYTYDLKLKAYTKNVDGEIIESDVGNLMRDLLTIYLQNVESSTGQYYASLANFNMDIWQEMLPGNDGNLVNDLIKDQYDVVYGDWPNDYNEVVLIMNGNNEISDIALYALGLIGQDYIDAVAKAIEDGAKVEDTGKYNDWSYEDICGTETTIILDSSCYKMLPDGTWTDLREVEGTLGMLYNNGIKIRISGIIRPNADATAHMLSGAIAYTKKLTEYVVNESENSDVVKAQKKDPTIDIFTGLPFGASASSLSNAEKKRLFNEYYSEASDTEKLNIYTEMLCIDDPEGVEKNVQALMTMMFGDPIDSERMRATIASMLAQQMGISEEMLKGYLDNMSDEQLLEMIRPSLIESGKATYKSTQSRRLNNLSEEEREGEISAYFENHTDENFATYYDEILKFSDATYEGNLAKLGNVDLEKPIAINIFASTFESKDVIAEEIERYNASVDEDQQITYTDLVALVMTAVTTIVDAITYVLIAFVAISLIVSSIMVGVITLISVQERTKEIGILRAIGASKRDVSHMFNAETIIIGFAAGLIGVLFTYILCLPINLLLHVLTGISSLSAVLPPLAALILVAISVLLTVFSGFIPSRSAAKKDPAISLRTE